MKKIIMTVAAVLLLSLSLASLSSCEFQSCDALNIKENIETIAENNKYDYAIVELFDGTTVRVDLVALQIGCLSAPNSYGNGGTDYMSYVYYLYAADGIGYMVDARNCMLINDVNNPTDVSNSNVKADVTISEVMLKTPGGEIKVIDGSDVESAGMKIIKCKDGLWYTLESRNILIKFTHNYQPEAAE